MLNLFRRNRATSAAPSLVYRRATFAPRSVDPEARTASVVFSTGAPVRRRDFEGEYDEVLSLDPSHVDLSRLRSANVLNSHNQDGLGSVLGVVTRADVNGQEATADVQFSARADVAPIFEDVQAGVIRNVSVGYTVEKYDERTDPASGRRQRVAVAWTPHEISLVPVGADPGAQVRRASGPAIVEAALELGRTTQGANGQTRAGIDQQIRQVTALAGLDEGFAAAQITRGASVQDARTAALEALASRDNPQIRNTATPSIVGGVDHNDPAVWARHMGEALFHRINPRHQPSEPARAYVGLSLPELAREMLRRHGMQTTGLSAGSVVTRALHTTSDFALVLGDTAARTLRMAYEAAPAGVRQVARQTTAEDFRTRHRVQIGEGPTLAKVNESGEFKRGTMSEAEETYKLETFGRIFGISRQAIINDNLGAFTDMAGRLGVAAAEFEAQQLVDLLTSGAGAGPTMSDGKALFHTDHGNLAAVVGAIDVTTLSAARQAMRLQKGLDGRPINVTPRFLLTPAAHETAAEQVLADLAASTVAEVNPFSGRLDLVVDSRLDAVSATRWYVVADPATIDGLEYAYLEGAQGPQTQSRNGFDVDGVETKVSLDFGAGFVEHRSWFSNDGA